MDGWVSLHRKIQDNELWLSEPFTKAQAWVDIFMNANHKDNTLNIRGNFLVVKRGQLGWSELTMVKRWRWSKNKVRRFLKWLETKHQIEQQKSSLTTIITIKNYDEFQPQTKHQTIQQKDTRRYTNNKVNNDNKILSKDNMVKDQYGNKYVEYVLDAFKKNVGAYPIEENRRNIAHNIVQITGTFIKRHGDRYLASRGNSPTFTSLIDKSWVIYNKNNEGTTTRRLKTFKQHYKFMLEKLESELKTL